MNSYERVMMVLQGCLPDVVPVGPFIGNCIAQSLGVPMSKYYSDGKVMAEVLYKGWEEYGYDMVFTHSDCFYISEAMGVETIKEGNSLPIAVKKNVSTLKDCTAIKIPNPQIDGRMPVYLEALSILKSKLGGKVILRGTGTGMFTLLSHIYSIQELLLDIAEMTYEESSEAKEKEKYYHASMEICTQALIAFTTAELECGANIVHLGDSLASLDVLSPEAFKRFVYPYLKKYFSTMRPILQKYNAYSLLHICGNNTKVLSDYASLDVDVYEVDYKVDLKECKEKIGSKMILLGNINPIELLSGTITQVEDICYQCLKTGAPKGMFVLGTGCEVPVDTPPENIKKMVECAHSYYY